MNGAQIPRATPQASASREPSDRDPDLVRTYESILEAAKDPTPRIAPWIFPSRFDNPWDLVSARARLGELASNADGQSAAATGNNVRGLGNGGLGPNGSGSSAVASPDPENAPWLGIPISNLQFTPDGEFLIVASASGSVDVFNFQACLSDWFEQVRTSSAGVGSDGQFDLQPRGFVLTKRAYELELPLSHWSPDPDILQLTSSEDGSKLHPMAILDTTTLRLVRDAEIYPQALHEHGLGPLLATLEPQLSSIAASMAIDARKQQRSIADAVLFKVREPVLRIRGLASLGTALAGAARWAHPLSASNRILLDTYVANMPKRQANPRCSDCAVCWSHAIQLLESQNIVLNCIKCACVEGPRTYLLAHGISMTGELRIVDMATSLRKAYLQRKRRLMEIAFKYRGVRNLTISQSLHSESFEGPSEVGSPYCSFAQAQVNMFNDNQPLSESTEARMNVLESKYTVNESHVLASMLIDDKDLQLPKSGTRTGWTSVAISERGRQLIAGTNYGGVAIWLLNYQVLTTNGEQADCNECSRAGSYNSSESSWLSNYFPRVYPSDTFVSATDEDVLDSDIAPSAQRITLTVTNLHVPSNQSFLRQSEDTTATVSVCAILPLSAERSPEKAVFIAGTEWGEIRLWLLEKGYLDNISTFSVCDPKHVLPIRSAGERQYYILERSRYTKLRLDEESQLPEELFIVSHKDEFGPSNYGKHNFRRQEARSGGNITACALIPYYSSDGDNRFDHRLLVLGTRSGDSILVDLVARMAIHELPNTQQTESHELSPGVFLRHRGPHRGLISKQWLSGAAQLWKSIFLNEAGVRNAPSTGDIEKLGQAVLSNPMLVCCSLAPSELERMVHLLLSPASSAQPRIDVQRLKSAALPNSFHDVQSVREVVSRRTDAHVALDGTQGVQTVRLMSSGHQPIRNSILSVPLVTARVVQSSSRRREVVAVAADTASTLRTSADYLLDNWPRILGVTYLPSSTEAYAQLTVVSGTSSVWLLGTSFGVRRNVNWSQMVSGIRATPKSELLSAGNVMSFQAPTLGMKRPREQKENVEVDFVPAARMLAVSPTPSLSDIIDIDLEMGNRDDGHTYESSRGQVVTQDEWYCLYPVSEDVYEQIRAIQGNRISLGDRISARRFQVQFGAEPAAEGSSVLTSTARSSVLIPFPQELLRTPTFSAFVAPNLIRPSLRSFAERFIRPPSVSCPRIAASARGGQSSYESHYVGMVKWSPTSNQASQTDCGGESKQDSDIDSVEAGWTEQAQISRGESFVIPVGQTGLACTSLDPVPSSTPQRPSPPPTEAYDGGLYHCSITATACHPKLQGVIVVGTSIGTIRVLLPGSIRWGFRQYQDMYSLLS